MRKYVRVILIVLIVLGVVAMYIWRFQYVNAPFPEGTLYRAEKGSSVEKDGIEYKMVSGKIIKGEEYCKKCDNAASFEPEDPVHDMKTYGVNLIIRTKSRIKWWSGKVIWTFLATLISYAVGYAVLLSLTYTAGGTFYGMREEAAILYNENFAALNHTQMLLVVFVFPIVTALTLSLLQLMLMFFFDEVTAYGVIVLLCVAGAFYETPIFVVGNYYGKAGHYFVG